MAFTHSNKPLECEPFAYTGFMEKSFQSIPSMTGIVRDVLKFKKIHIFDIFENDQVSPVFVYWR